MGKTGVAEHSGTETPGDERGDGKTKWKMEKEDVEGEDEEGQGKGGKRREIAQARPCETHFLAKRRKWRQNVHILQRNSLTLVHRTGPLAILFMLTRK
jgi:hypothetical protein